MPKISIIVPVYNVESYLVECIESIVSQTFSDFELILIDDGSTDGSGRICDSYAKRYSCVHVLHKTNQGQSVARNDGVQRAKGKWIHFVDSDDILHPQMLEILIKALEDTGAHISMCGAEENEKCSEDFMMTRAEKWRKSVVNQRYLEYLCENGKHRYWTVWGKLIDRNILLKYPFTEGRIYEDNAIVCKWLCEAKIVADVPENLYFYRINLSGTTKNGFDLKKLDYLWALEEQLEFYRIQQFWNMYKIIFEKYFNSVLNYYLKLRIELADKRSANRIKNKMLTIKYQNKTYIDISKQDVKRMRQTFYPRIMTLLNYVYVGKKLIKEKGIKAFVKKLIDFVKG